MSAPGRSNESPSRNPDDAQGTRNRDALSLAERLGLVSSAIINSRSQALRVAEHIRDRARFEQAIEQVFEQGDAETAEGGGDNEQHGSVGGGLLLGAVIIVWIILNHENNRRARGR